MCIRDSIKGRRKSLTGGIHEFSGELFPRSKGQGMHQKVQPPQLLRGLFHHRIDLTVVSDIAHASRRAGQGLHLSLIHI